MAKKKIDHKRHFTMVTLTNFLLGIVTGTGPFIEFIEELIAKQADKMLQRTLSVATVYFMMLTGFIVLVGGGVLLIIDYTSIPRGVAFALAGLFLIAGSTLWMQLSKK